jgi:hypothetical protein
MGWVGRGIGCGRDGSEKEQTLAGLELVCVSPCAFTDRGSELYLECTISGSE